MLYHFMFRSLAFCIALGSPLTFANEPIKVASRGDGNAEYAIKMLALAIEKSGEQYAVDVRDEALTSARLREELIDGTLDVIWTATNSDMEENTLPVRIPLYKGLLGYRVLIVHADNANLFANVKTKRDLDRFTFGQGRGWTDTTILQASGLKVEVVSRYEGMFYMVDGKRFDAFPRGVHEPWGELAARPELDLTVDRNILLIYKMPYYLFVSPKRPELAEDLARGLRRAVDDGSFDEIFLNDPTVQMVMTNANIKGRTAFMLDNPDLPAETPLDDETLWFDVDSL